MARHARLDAPGTFHHVMIRGIEKSPIFEDDQDRKDFISSGEIRTIPFSASSMPNTSIVARRAIMKKLLVIAALGLLYLVGCIDSLAEQLRDGDIIFQTSRSEQSFAIQKATRSQYSHMGIVFFRNGSSHVYEAINTVQYTPLHACPK